MSSIKQKEKYLEKVNVLLQRRMKRRKIYGERKYILEKKRETEKKEKFLERESIF